MQLQSKPLLLQVQMLCMPLSVGSPTVPVQCLCEYSNSLLPTVKETAQSVLVPKTAPFTVLYYASGMGLCSLLYFASSAIDGTLLCGVYLC